LVDLVGEKLDIFHHVPQVLGVDRYVGVSSLLEAVGRQTSASAEHTPPLGVGYPHGSIKYSDVAVASEYIIPVGRVHNTSKVKISNWELDELGVLVGLEEVVHEVCV
jgi:hypothetical protein